jgi:type IV pilus assembly protein PilE
MDESMLPLLPRSRRGGFTLIELLVVLVIIGILASIALPSYSKYVVRSKRSAAQSIMYDISNREEQYMLANRSYADKATLESNGYRLPPEVAQNYSYKVTVNTTGAPGYTIAFTAIGNQASDVNLSLTNTGVKTPAEKW